MKKTNDKPQEGSRRVVVAEIERFALPPRERNRNAFRVTYQDGRWDDVEAWTGRRLDARNETKYVYVYC